MDPLSDVLRATRLSGAHFSLVRAGAPWRAAVRAARHGAAVVLPRAEHVFSCHVLAAGACWATVAGEPPVRLRAGDAVLFPHGDAHVLSGEPDARAADAPHAPTPAHLEDTLYLGPDGARDTTIVCGVLGCDARPFHPLLAALPRCVHVPGVAGGWLPELSRRAVAESRAPRAGGAAALARTAELLFIEAVRHHARSLPPGRGGWLAGLGDEVVGAALSCLHARPAHPWTLADLARAVAASRSVLAARFSSLVGVPPMLYLTRWRIALAADRLADGSASVAAVAALVGYDSEPAFSRAFKRETGVPPASWRRIRQGRRAAG